MACSSCQRLRCASSNCWKPGVSISQLWPSGRMKARLKVVVWRPLDSAVEISLVCWLAVGTRALSRVDLPMPLWPSSTVRLPTRRSCTGSSEAGSFRAEMGSIG